MKEEWKKINGFENYKVSSLGRVKNKKGKIMNPWNDSHGYLDIKLYKDKKSTHKKIHRLVAENFIPNPENKPQVNHINGISSINEVSNLEWVTAKENIGHLKNTKGISNQFSKSNKVTLYDLEGNLVKTFETATKAAQELGFKNHTGKFDARQINNCCKGNKESHKGKRFCYFDEKPSPSIGKYIKKTRNGIKIEAENILTKETYLFKSVIEASEKLKIDRTCIFDVLKGEIKTTKNFSFKKTK